MLPADLKRPSTSFPRPVRRAVGARTATPLDEGLQRAADYARTMAVSRTSEKELLDFHAKQQEGRFRWSKSRKKYTSTVETPIPWTFGNHMVPARPHTSMAKLTKKAAKDRSARVTVEQKPSGKKVAAQQKATGKKSVTQQKARGKKGAAQQKEGRAQSMSELGLRQVTLQSPVAFFEGIRRASTSPMLGVKRLTALAELRDMAEYCSGHTRADAYGMTVTAKAFSNALHAVPDGAFSAAAEVVMPGKVGDAAGQPAPKIGTPGPLQPMATAADEALDWCSLSQGELYPEGGPVDVIVGQVFDGGLEAHRRWGMVNQAAVGDRVGERKNVSRLAGAGGIAAVVAAYSQQVDPKAFDSSDDEEEDAEKRELTESTTSLWLPTKRTPSSASSCTVPMDGQGGKKLGEGIVQFSESCGSTLWQQGDSMFSFRKLGSGELGVSTGSQLSTERRLMELDGHKLALGRYGVGPAGAATIAEFMKKSSNLEEADLTNNRLGDPGVIELCAALPDSQVAILNLSRNKIGQHHKGPAAIAEALRAPSCLLEDLDLSANNLTDIAIGCLMQALATNCSVTSLQLRENAFGDGCCGDIKDMMLKNTTMKTLGLGSGRIKHTGLKLISAGLVGCVEGKGVPLESLDLSWNSVGNAGAMALAEVLDTNQVLTAVDLSHNRIGVDGAGALAEGMRTNMTLTRLVLSWNPIQDIGLASLMEVLQMTGCVTELEIQNIQAGVTSEKMSFDPRHAGGHHRLDLSKTADRWVARMLKRQALSHPGDAWSNVTLNRKPFEMRGTTDTWKIPDHGILELDYVPCDVPTGRRAKYSLDLSDPTERSTVERLWQRMLIIPEEIWENVQWNDSKLRPKTVGVPWKPPAAGILQFDHVILVSKPSQRSELYLELDLSDRLERDLLYQLLVRAQVEKGVKVDNLVINGNKYAPEVLQVQVPASGHCEINYSTSDQRYEASYFLDLSKTGDRALALRLRERARVEPGENWLHEKIDGKPFSLDEKSREHEWTIPKSGILELDFRTSRPCQMHSQHVTLQLGDKWDQRVALSFLERSYQEAGNNIYNSTINRAPYEVNETIASLRCMPMHGVWAFDYVGAIDAAHFAVSKTQSTDYTLLLSDPAQFGKAQDLRLRALVEPHFDIVDSSVDNKPFVFHKDARWKVPMKGLLQMTVTCIDTGEEVMSDNEMQKLISQLVKVNNRIERMNVLRNIVSKNYFTVHQAKMALRAFNESADMGEALLMMQPKLVDPHRLQSALKLISSTEDQDFIRAQLKASSQ